MNIQPSSRFAVSMHTKTSHPQFNSKKYSVKPANKQLKNLAEKYRTLVTLEDPDDNEQEQLEKILELAVFDMQLNELLVNVDEQVANFCS
jgi:hypothetical protein